jgi:phospholipase A1
MVFSVSISFADEASNVDESLPTMATSDESVSEEWAFAETASKMPGLAEKVEAEHYATNNPYLLLPHKPNYFMPVAYQTKINQEEQEEFYDGISIDDEEDGEKPKVFDHTEIVFQVSIKYIVAENIVGKHSNLAVAYTGKSYWQAYNSDISALFRETNHEPEIILGFSPGFSWSDHMTVSFNHQSNGQVGNLSRSWNRIIFSTAKVWPDRLLNVRAWYRLPEDKKETPNSMLGDDNPDIQKYMGYGDVFYLRKFGEHSFGVTARNNLRPGENLGSIELDWTFPLPGKMKGFVQYFNGYGESLIDYDQYQERIGIGIKISDWL